MNKGVVVKSTGSWYQVRLEDDKVWDSRIVGKFRLNGQKITNPVAVGDEVMVLLDEENQTALIKEILPRRNYVARQSPRKKHDVHLLASNVDQAVVIITIVEPKLKQGFIDRFLLMTEPYNIPAAIICNKSDLYDEEDMEMFELLKEIYQPLGYKMWLTSIIDGTGLEQMKQYLAGKITLLSGQSGVGKSSLVNSIQPHLTIRTGDISDHSGKGQHTTTFAEMHPLDFGGTIIDTPGIKSLSFNNLEVMDVGHNFRDIFSVSKLCKFGDCTHRNEPDCAVKEAVAEGIIHEMRYNNYLAILDEIEDQDYWARNEM